MDALITSPASVIQTPASRMQRVLAYLIDMIPAFVLGLLSIIPLVNFISAALLFFYMLFRDAFSGASLGKRALGLQVVDKSGAPASTRQCLGRNLLLALPSAIAFIPVLGQMIDAGILSFLVLIETVCLLIVSERLGDMMAGTKVIKVR